MATVQSTSEAARRAERLRELWERANAPVIRHFRKIGNYLVERPAMAQGVYYALAGLWPLGLIHLFRATAGETMWLSQVAGVLMLVIGAALCIAAYRHNRAIEVWTIGLGIAGGLLALELASIIHGGISPAYLIDAFLQAGIVALWVANWARHRSDQTMTQTMTAPVAAVAAPAQVYPTTPAH